MSAQGDCEFLVQRARELVPQDLWAAKAWLITARSLYPADFNIQVSQTRRVSTLGGAQWPRALCAAAAPPPQVTPTLLHRTVDQPSPSASKGGGHTVDSGLIDPSQCIFATRAQGTHSLITVAAVCSVPASFGMLRPHLIPEAQS